jgi:hypothetical protein
MKAKNSYLTSIVFMISIWIVSVYLLMTVLLLHSFLATASALIIVFWNTVITILISNKWGKTS